MSDFLSSWTPIVESFFESEKGKSLSAFLDQRRADGAVIYPNDPFYALRKVKRGEVRILILGQDPYHGPGQAQGLAFSVNDGMKLPPSLRNIFKEIQRTLGGDIPKNGSLVNWAEQGVLLLNTVLTVEDGQPFCHAKKGWEVLTDAIVRDVAKQLHPVVFMLWGKPAQTKIPLIEAESGKHLILTSNHPSPLSATKGAEPFIGNNHFVQANEWLEEQGISPIQWLKKDQGMLF